MAAIQNPFQNFQNFQEFVGRKLNCRVIPNQQNLHDLEKTIEKQRQELFAIIEKEEKRKRHQVSQAVHLMERIGFEDSKPGNTKLSKRYAQLPTPALNKDFQIFPETWGQIVKHLQKCPQKTWLEIRDGGVYKSVLLSCFDNKKPGSLTALEWTKEGERPWNSILKEFLVSEITILGTEEQRKTIGPLIASYLGPNIPQVIFGYIPFFDSDLSP